MTTGPKRRHGTSVVGGRPDGRPRTQERGCHSGDTRAQVLWVGLGGADLLAHGLRVVRGALLQRRGMLLALLRRGLLGGLGRGLGGLRSDGLAVLQRLLAGLLDLVL